MKIKFVLSFLVLSAAFHAAAEQLPGETVGPFTRPDLAPSLLAQPALLGMDRSFRFAYSGYYTEEGFTDDHRLTLSGYGFGFSFLKESSSGSVFRRYSLGWGMASSSKNNFFGIALDWFGSGDNPALDGLTLFRIGWSSLLFDSFLLHLGVRNFVFSDHAYGYARPGAQVGIGFRPWNGLFGIHLGFDADWEGGDYLFTADVAFRPFNGLELGAQYYRDRTEARIGVSMALTLGHARMGSRVLFKDGLGKSRYTLSFSSTPSEGLVRANNRVLLLDLAAPVATQPEVKGVLNRRRVLTFLDILRALDHARRDPGTRMVYLRIRGRSLGYGRSEELIAMLRRVKKAGKKIYAYLENGDALQYAIASTANRVYLQPEVNLNLRGVGMAVTFLKNFFDKLGLEAQIFYKGKYKSAAQQLMLDRMSPEHRESEQLLVNRMYRFLIRTIAENRTGGDVKKVEKWFVRGLWHPDEAEKAGLVNKAWSDQDVRKLFRMFGLRLVRLGEYLTLSRKLSVWKKTPPAIAVINVTGSIVNGTGGRNPLPIFGGTMAGADTVIENIRRAASASAVRAVIIRVQSGGGDLVASDKMWRFINRVREIKKVYISFGDIAASGGYYLACGSKKTKSRIFAPKTCVTGSIGVFTGKVVAAKLKKKIGLDTSFVQAGRRAFYWSGNRRFDGDEEKLIIRSLNRYYVNFVSKVAAGRRLSLEKAEAAAQGRVWSGFDARELGLVDDNLDFWGVVELAARESGLSSGSFRLLQLPVYRPGLLKSMTATAAGTLTSGMLGKLADIGNPAASLMTGRIQAMLPYHVMYY